MKLIQCFLLSLFLLLMVGCTDQVCIDADDFGFSYFKVPAYYDNSEIQGSDNSQYTPWIDSGFTLSGNNLNLIVKNWDPKKNINSSPELSAWCPWLGPSASPPSLYPICTMLDKCYFLNNDTCSAGYKAAIVNAPCLLKNGVGLYFVAAPRGYNPNDSMTTNITPQVNTQAIVKHLGASGVTSDGTPVTFYDMQIDPKNNTSTFVPTGGFTNTMTPQQSLDLVGGKLYFKIIDTYYKDNSGQYIVQIKSGITTKEWDPMAYVVSLVRDFFFGAQTNTTDYSIKETGIIKQIFNNIITQKSYKLAVSSMLTAAVLFYAMNFLIGNVEMTHKDLLERVVKILIVSQLLTTETAWNFFYEYLFNYFITGSQSLAKIIQDSGGSGAGSTNIMAFMLAPSTLIKLISLPLISWPNVGGMGFSILYIIVYFVTLVGMMIVLFYAAVSTVICLTMMGLIVALSPIFISFLLFEQTRDLFEGWLKQLMSYALQTLIIVAGITLMTMIIKHQIYQTLGFRVCKNYFFYPTIENSSSMYVKGSDERSTNLYYWKPVYNVPSSVPNQGEQLTEILIPEAHFEDDGNTTFVSNNSATGRFCQEYECIGKRYPSFPYLDPENSNDLRLLQQFWSGNFTSQESLLMMIACVVLLGIFVATAADVGASIVGGGSGVSGSAGAITSSTVKAAMYAGGKVVESASSGTKKSVRRLMTNVKKLTGLSAAESKNSLGDSVSSSFRSMGKISSVGEDIGVSFTKNNSSQTSSSEVEISFTKGQDKEITDSTSAEEKKIKKDEINKK